MPNPNTLGTTTSTTTLLACPACGEDVQATIAIGLTVRGVHAKSVACETHLDGLRIDHSCGALAVATPRDLHIFNGPPSAFDR